MVPEKENTRIELSDHLFRDLPVNRLDMDRNKKLIIERESGIKEQQGRMFRHCHELLPLHRETDDREDRTEDNHRGWTPKVII